MKLYTEEQVKQMIEKSQDTGLTAEYLILTRPPIELPSDEEIEEKAMSLPIEKFGDLYNEGINEGFYLGVEYMKEQILNQNK